MNVLELYKTKLLEPKKAGSTHGGEWCGPCPGCGGDDRFRIWPEQNNGNGSFWCRQCGKTGDPITFLMEFEGKTYPDACKALDIKMEKREYRTPMAPETGKDKHRTSNIQHRTLNKKKSLPPDIWMEKAGALVEWAHGKLLENNEQLAWLNNRGIDSEAVKRFCLGWNPGKDGQDLWRPRESWGLPTVIKTDGKKKRLRILRGLVIPYIIHFPSRQVRRIRIRRGENKKERRLEGKKVGGSDRKLPRYYILPGSDMDMMVIGDEPRVFLVVESELDAIMCHALAGDLCSMIALGSSSAKPDGKLMENLRKSAVILLTTDYDSAGAKAITWWKQEFSQVKTWPVPVGSDPGEAYQVGIDIRAWIGAGLPEGWQAGSLKRGVRIGRSASGKNSINAKNKNQMIEDKEQKLRGIEELAGLLQKHPVTIYNSELRTHISAPGKWQQQNRKIYKRISELVFRDMKVLRYICHHQAEKITGENIII